MIFCWNQCDSCLICVWYVQISEYIQHISIFSPFLVKIDKNHIGITNGTSEISFPRFPKITIFKICSIFQLILNKNGQNGFQMFCFIADKTFCLKCVKYVKIFQIFSTYLKNFCFFSLIWLKGTSTSLMEPPKPVSQDSQRTRFLIFCPISVQIWIKLSEIASNWTILNISFVFWVIHLNDL